MNSMQQFRVMTREAGRAEFAVVITGPSGGSVTAHVVPVADGYVVNFTPTEVGEYRLSVTLGGETVRGPGGGAGPYRVVCTQASDPGKVTACGPGLCGGLVNRPAEFTIDTKRAGQGGLGVTVEGPSEAAINCRDNGDGTCSVAYMPRDAGDYVVNITFNDRPIPGSPFNALIGTALMASNVRASGNGLLANGKTDVRSRCPSRTVCACVVRVYAISSVFVVSPPWFWARRVDARVTNRLTKFNRQSRSRFDGRVVGTRPDACFQLSVSRISNAKFTTGVTVVRLEPNEAGALTSHKICYILKS